MNAKRILLAGMVLVLTGARAWAATEAPRTAGFAVIPDDEAAQVTGGDGVGYECNVLQRPTFYWPCGDESQSECSTAYAYNEAWSCSATRFGECYDQPTIVGWQAQCEWTNECQQSGDWVPVWGTDCM
ncbi:MAG: hypothetical protein NTZ17_19525 [Phycisphaerae bacterium]|jgi:hypothetical protein|nr:hypothetical protein [Phycisphaerae bacterium]